jgi:hypothetical protein
MNDLVEKFDLIHEYTADAKGIAYDTCHKIYILMDDNQVDLMKSYGYGDENDPDTLITNDQLDSVELARVVMKWYEQSCALRFIQATRSNPTDPNEGFVDIISQFENNDDEDDDDE